MGSSQTKPSRQKRGRKTRNSTSLRLEWQLIPDVCCIRRCAVATQLRKCRVYSAQSITRPHVGVRLASNNPPSLVLATNRVLGNRMIPNFWFPNDFWIKWMKRVNRSCVTQIFISRNYSCNNSNFSFSFSFSFFFFFAVQLNSILLSCHVREGVKV